MVFLLPQRPKPSRLAAPQVIPASWLRLFSPGEVNQLLGGGDAAGLDVDDMQAHAQYRWVWYQTVQRGTAWYCKMQGRYSSTILGYV